MRKEKTFAYKEYFINIHFKNEVDLIVFLAAIYKSYRTYMKLESFDYCIRFCFDGNSDRYRTMLKMINLRKFSFDYLETSIKSVESASEKIDG